MGPGVCAGGPPGETVCPWLLRPPISADASMWTLPEGFPEGVAGWARNFQVFYKVRSAHIRLMDAEDAAVRVLVWF